MRLYRGIDGTSSVFSLDAAYFVQSVDMQGNDGLGSGDDTSAEALSTP